MVEETTQAVDTGSAQTVEQAVEEEGGAPDAPHEEQQGETEAEQASRIGELEAALSDGERRLSGLDGLLGQRDVRISGSWRRPWARWRALSKNVSRRRRD